MPRPISTTADALDLQPRFVHSEVVVASPAAAAETIIASVTVTSDTQVLSGALLQAYAALTVGTAGTAIRLRIRDTNVTGTVRADTGALTGGIAAGNLVAQDLNGFSATVVTPGQVYVLTLQVTAATAPSTVSAAQLLAIVI